MVIKGPKIFRVGRRPSNQQVHAGASDGGNEGRDDADGADDGGDGGDGGGDSGVILMQR